MVETKLAKRCEEREKLLDLSLEDFADKARHDYSFFSPVPQFLEQFPRFIEGSIAPLTSIASLLGQSVAM
jgi:hypothetical protein